MSDLMAHLQAALHERYTIERELGQGGNGAVYLAHDRKHDRRVAIKVLPPELALAVRTERFLREIQICARLAHPHILMLIDSGETAGCLYYVMPYVEGESLRKRLLREQRIPIPQALEIAREVAEALSYAHGRDVVHRDIKPENILLEAGQPIVADFGIARALTEAGGPRVTETGMTVGTPGYMSPEQSAGSLEVDGRSDVYSLGCVLYEMVTGESPFFGKMADLPPVIARVINRAMATQAGERFATAADFAEAIAELQISGPIARVLPDTGTRSWRSPRRVMALGTALVALGGGYGAWARLVHGDSVPRLAVLPFQNLGATGDEYLADGITEEITSRLSGTRGLAVISAASAMQYKQSKATLRQIGAELGVEYVLVGSIHWQRADRGPSRVQVRPQLVRVADDQQLWGDTYDESMAQVFAVQTRIAEQVVGALGVALADPERRTLTTIPTHNLEAYDYLLRGMDYTRRGSLPADYRAAMDMYRRALEIDPSFGAAYAQLSMAHTVYWYLFEHTDDQLAAAKQAADRAVELNASDAPLALGYYYYRGFRDYARALEYFTVAERAQPSNGAVIYAIGAAYKWRGDWERAIDYYQRAMELDPRARGTAYELASTLTFLRRYKEAQRYFDLAIAIRPDNPSSYVRKAWLQILWKGDRTLALATLEKGSQRAGVERIFSDLLGAGFGPYGWWVSTVLGANPNYRAMVSGLSPGSAGIDSAAFYLNAAALAERAEEGDRKRAYLDSARVPLERDVARTPGNARTHAMLGAAYAGLGMKEPALREGRAALDLVPVSRDAQAGSDYIINFGLIAARVGEPDTAATQFGLALSIPSRMSATLLELDPVLEALQESPSFRALAGGIRVRVAGR